MRVLLTDGDQRSTLAATRALGRAGVNVIVGESTIPCLASRSRHSFEALQYPSPYTDEAAFVRAIADAADRVDLVIPMTDISNAVLTEHRDRLHGVNVAAVDHDTFWRASDKIALHSLAESLAVPTPTLHYVHQPDDVSRLDDVAFPCVLKPARSRLRTSEGWLKTSVEVARNRPELDRLLRTRPELQHPFMIQRFVEGEGVGVFALCDRGEPRMLFAHRRIREKPPSGGVSVLRESVPVDRAAGEYALRLLKELRWHGVAMVEFRKEHSTGEHYLMEINARFWGSLQLAIDAGLNFPVELMKLWTGQPVPEQLEYRTGVRSRWLLGDLDSVLMRLRGSDATPQNAPPVMSLLVDFCRFFRRDTRLEIESLHDPGPSLHEIRSYARDVFQSLCHARG